MTGVGLSLDDLFLAGIGLDLAGAFFIGKGVLADRAQLAEAFTWGGSMTRSPLAVRDRVDAEAGAGLLAVGFTLQLIGYLALLSGRSAATGASSKVATGALVALAAIGFGVLAWLVCQKWRLRRLLVGVAKALTVQRGADPNDAAPDGVYLMRSGELLYRPISTGETGLEFVATVFHVRNAVPPREPYGHLAEADKPPRDQWPNEGDWYRWITPK